MRPWHILALLGLLGTSHAAAQDREEGGARLAWVRGEGAEPCPSSAALEAEVERRLGRDPFQEPVTQTIEGVVRRAADGTWTAELYDRDASGQLLGARHLTSESADCASLASAVALAVALAIDPDAAMRQTELGDPAPAAPADTEAGPPGETATDGTAAEVAEPAAGPSPAEPEPEPVSEPAPVTEPEPVSEEPAEDRPPSARARLSATSSWELVPGLAPGLALDVDARAWGPFRVVVGMRYVPEQRTDEPTADFGFGLTAARIGGCAMTTSERVSFGGCLSVLLGALHAVVYRPVPLDPGDRFFSALDVSAEVALLVVEPVFVAAAAGVTVPFVRDRFRVEGRDSVEFQQAVLVPTGALSAGVRFP